MKKIAEFFLSATAAVIMLFTPAPAVMAKEVFTNYDAAIQINADSSLTVVENIRAQVENVEIQRGIVRVFPVKYQDKQGNPVTVGFQLLETEIDGRPAKARISNDGRFTEVRIGDPDVVLTRGLHNFMIAYKTTRQLGFFENHDELYWNVTGNDWNFPILSASCRVALPGKNFGEGFRSIEWYTGFYGGKGDINDATLTPDGTVMTTRALSQGEGLTVVYTWPKGLVTPPPPPMQDNTPGQIAVAAATLVLISLWLGCAWFKWGKGPQVKAVIPQFYPPDGASPAYTRYIYKMRADQTGFAAAIIGLAVRGAIKIKEEEKLPGDTGGKITLLKEPQTPDGLKPEEITLLKNLFGARDALEVTESNGGKLLIAMAGLNARLHASDKLLIKNNTLKMFPAIAIYLLGAAALYPFSVRFPFYIIVGLVIIFLGMLAGINTARTALGGFKKIVPAALLIAVINVSALWGSGAKGAPTLLFLASAWIIAVMRQLMISYTGMAGDLLSDIKGLRLYMDTAEKSRLEMLNPPEETPALFERLLPYALALDVAKTWADRFAKILQTAQYKPVWYVGPSPYVLMDTGNLVRLSSNLQNRVSSSMPKPELSPGSYTGSSGRGFSGGGGGGGGGRGW